MPNDKEPDFSDVESGSSSTAPPPDAAAGGQTYTAVKGDSLSKIAKRFYGSAGQWKKIYEELAKNGKKSVLFIMTDDTRNCDEVPDYLEARYDELKGAVRADRNSVGRAGVAKAAVNGVKGAAVSAATAP